MKAAKVVKTKSNGFSVVDIRTGETIRRNLNGSKAAAYVEYYNEEVRKAELLWERYA